MTIPWRAAGVAILGANLAVREGRRPKLIVWMDRRRDGWFLRFDSGEVDPPTLTVPAVVFSPATEAWFRGSEGPGLCAWCQELFLPTRRGQQYCTARCRSAGYRRDQRERRGQRG